MIELGVNIDHVATLREARKSYDPDPVWAAVEAQLGGADGITVHLREDRRHIQDHDLRRLLDTVQIRVNLEMAATEEMIDIACSLDPRPHLVMLVPEGRQEITTEGGLDIRSQKSRLRDCVSRLHQAGLMASAFIDADSVQIEAAAGCGISVCEVHTGPWAHAVYEGGRSAHQAAARDELSKIARAGDEIRRCGMRFNAGHALNYCNVQPIAALPGLRELHIGHAIVCRAVFDGLRKAVTEMKRLMREAAAAPAQYLPNEDEMHERA